MKFTTFLNELEQFPVKQTGENTWNVSEGDTIIGTIKRYPDDGGYFKGTINADKAYKGSKTSTNELSLGNAKLFVVALWKEYQKENFNNADNLSKLQDEYTNLLSQLGTEDKKVVNDFLKSQNNGDKEALTSSIAFLKKRYNLTVKDAKK
jgi:hypothetical protein